MHQSAFDVLSICRAHQLLSRDESTPGPESAPDAPGPAPAAATHLSAIVVQNPNGTVYDLSAPFNPDRLQYASIVSEDMDTAMLCLVPEQGKAHPSCHMHTCSAS